ncbi:hypothetical protein [Haloterrigena turkmenica]|uniref:hypothetical protein n=1 Tax=Haloterrigena turkmenica TaxID=62320 RepID=UPI001CF7CD29|nr:hypothetical protein [Haloterrigena turkmenica]
MRDPNVIVRRIQFIEPTQGDAFGVAVDRQRTDELVVADHVPRFKEVGDFFQLSWGDDIPVGKRLFSVVLDDTQSELTFVDLLEFEEMLGLLADVFLGEVVAVGLDDRCCPVERLVIDLLERVLTTRGETRTKP